MQAWKISGTPTPDGNYGPRQISLAKKYMAKFWDIRRWKLLSIILHQALTFEEEIISDGTLLE